MVMWIGLLLWGFAARGTYLQPRQVKSLAFTSYLEKYVYLQGNKISLILEQTLDAEELKEFMLGR